MKVRLDYFQNNLDGKRSFNPSMIGQEYLYNFKGFYIWLHKKLYKARFPLTYFAAAGEKFRHRKSSFVVLSRHQRKVKQMLKILSNCSRRTNFFRGE